jgi:hypothetical protein
MASVIDRMRKAWPSKPALKALLQECSDKLAGKTALMQVAREHGVDEEDMGAVLSAVQKCAVAKKNPAPKKKSGKGGGVSLREGVAPKLAFRGIPFDELVELLRKAWPSKPKMQDLALQSPQGVAFRALGQVCEEHGVDEDDIDGVVKSIIAYRVPTAKAAKLKSGQVIKAGKSMYRVNPKATKKKEQTAKVAAVLSYVPVAGFKVFYPYFQIFKNVTIEYVKGEFAKIHQGDESFRKKLKNIHVFNTVKEARDSLKKTHSKLVEDFDQQILEFSQAKVLEKHKKSDVIL